MDALIGTIISLILAVTLRQGDAIKCLECTDIPHPSVCNNVANCHDNSSSCFLREYITSSGAVLFESGCKSKQSCDLLGKRDAQRASDVTNYQDDNVHDVNICIQCCSGSDYCNLEGCKNKAVDRSKRGLYCYECDVENNKFGCRTLTQCSTEEVCSIQKSIFPDMYTTGCVRRQTCDVIHTPLTMNMTTSRSRRTSGISIHLPYCCDDDFCNDVLDFVTSTNTVVNGSWSDWNDWSSCTKTCGSDGVQTRTRTCDNPPPLNNGQDCEGSANETSICTLQGCPVDGAWSSWKAWTTCTQSCGDGGQHYRVRFCDNPAPQNHGAFCGGQYIETENCSTNPCPIDGGWSSWGSWSHCSHTCGNGLQTRFRTCNNPVPLHNGEHCHGSTINRKTCHHYQCPVDGGWSDWAAWSACSATCGDATKSRVRHCDNPAPAHFGAYCIGESQQNDSCSLAACLVHGVWSDWGAWSSCSATCGDATMYRNRHCEGPSVHRICAGTHKMTADCHQPNCTAVYGVWSDWGRWSSCSATCGNATMSRFRHCEGPSVHSICAGNHKMTADCLQPECAEEKCKHAGYDYFHSDGVWMCLYFSPHHHSWATARHLCQQDGGGLVTPSNPHTDHALRHYISLKIQQRRLTGDNRYVWLGLYVPNNRWEWVDPSEHFMYHRFNDHQLHELKHDHCGLGGGDMGETWYSEKCSVQYYYICQLNVS